MPLITLDAQEKLQKPLGFYVPQYRIEINGEGLPSYVLRDIIQVTYKDSIDALDSFELTVANWDAATNQFKYIGSETESTLNSGSLSQQYKLFEPCAQQVQLNMGYVDNMELMLTGNFSTMEPLFSSGPQSLNVRGLNVLHKLRRKKYSGGWDEKTDSQIAEDIGRKRDRELGRNRFPIPIRIKPPREEPSYEFVGQKNEYDIDFLWKRARTRGYVVNLRIEDGQEVLYFGPSVDTSEPTTYQLEWGKSLIEFKPTLTTANQFRSVTVNGWDRARQQSISVKVDLDDRELNRLNPDLHRLITACDPREEYVVDEPVFTEEQARQRARALLLDQSKQMVKANCKTVGLPKLRSGSKVKILGVGSRLQGDYFVTETTHTMNDSGYITEFKARREDSASSS